MTNKYQPHVLVLPEDGANEQIATGFVLEPALKSRCIQILPPAKGWGAVRDSFVYEHNAEMARYLERRMVLLIDFDERGEDRLAQVMREVKPALRDRVFAVGARGEPEGLRRELGDYEQIGRALARDCVEKTSVTWGHPSLSHNQGELARMMAHLRPILFG